jgi:MoxR-like ATPase
VTDGVKQETALEPATEARLREQLVKLQAARDSVSKVVHGQHEAVDQLLMSLMAGGHVLIEGAPGLGKTLLVRTIGRVCGLDFSRIQFTPDLMPADITGTTVLIHDDQGRAHSEFQRGPVFAQMVLTDEINRATPKTQSALLEAMQEYTVTAGGRVHPLPQPFFVLATQNPIEMEGTYVLPEAQIDRFFFKVDIPFPGADVLDLILSGTTGTERAVAPQVLTPQEILELQELTRSVPVASHVRAAVVRLVLATQPQEPAAHAKVRRYVRFGLTPRGAQALILGAKAHALLRGRFNVSFGDVRAVLGPALRHRFQLNYEGVAAGISPTDLLVELFDAAAAAPA